MLAQLMSIFGAIVTVAMAAVIVGSPNTANIITAWTSGFANSITAAKS